jgi:hypothetical protein
MYNISYIANSSGIVEFVQRTNDGIMQGWLGDLILLAIFAILFLAVANSTKSSKKAFASASFVCLILSLLMRGMSLVPNWMIYLLLAMCAGSIALLKSES